MDRYTYVPDYLAVSQTTKGSDGEDVVFADDIEGYKIHDTRGGNTEDSWIAFSRDPDTAQRICGLLNADEREKCRLDKFRLGVSEMKQRALTVRDTHKG